MSSTMEIKQQNLDCIRDAIQAEGSGTKAGLSRATGLSVATCNNLLNEMYKNGELLQTEQEESQGGRKASRFVYNKDYRHVLGVYVKMVGGVRHVGYAVANALGEIVEQEVRHPDWIDCDYLAGLLGEILARDALIHVAAVAIPGNVYEGAVECCDIHSLEGLNLEEVLQQRLKIRVLVENDMNFIAYGASWKIGQQDHSLMAIDFPADDCVGAGIVINGKIYKGFSRFAGELSFALEEAGIPREKQVAAEQDKAEILRIICKSILMVICVLNPDCIVLMCGVLEDGDLETIRTYCQQFVRENHIPKITLSRSYYEFCVDGMIRATLNSLRYQFQLTV